MKPLTREWVDKAEGDFITARRELRARKAPNYDASCFHAQQCAEKYLKARLQEEGIAFSRPHDLATLLDLLLPVEPLWAGMRADLDRLTSYAVEFRYPGTSADKAMARSAVDVSWDVRQRVRVSLGLMP